MVYVGCIQRSMVAMLNMNNMENKYYQPTIDEFHVGFEYYFSSAYQEGVSFTEVTIDGKDYEPEVFNFDIWNYSRGKGESWKDLFENMLKHDQIKVKYLDREDVESLGFKQLEDVINVFKYNTPYSTQGLLDEKYWEYWHISLLDRSDKYPNILIDNNKDYDNMCVLFEGKIKNKSELKILLKQLGISE